MKLGHFSEAPLAGDKLGALWRSLCPRNHPAFFEVYVGPGRYSKTSTWRSAWQLATAGFAKPTVAAFGKAGVPF